MIKVGFDLDGVILENASFKQKAAKEIFNLDLEHWQLTSNVLKNFMKVKEDRDKINTYTAHNSHAKFVDNVIPNLLEKIKSFGVSIYLISRRGRSNEGVENAYKSIEELKIGHFFENIIFCESDEEKIEKIKENKIDIFIEDRIKVINDITQEFVHFPILFDEHNLIKKGLLDFKGNCVVINNLISVLEYVKILVLIEKVLDKVPKSVLVKNEGFKIISYLNNIVVKVNDYYLKIYEKNKSTFKDNELLLYRKISKPHMFKELVFDGFLNFQDEVYGFAIFKEILGKTIDYIEYKTYAKVVARAVLLFINQTSKIKCNKFGDIDENLEGNYNSFSEYIFDFQHKSATTLYLNEITRKYSVLGYNLLVKYEKLFQIKESFIIPVDLNFKNIMLASNEQIKIIDPGSIIAGPIEMSYGEFMAHSFGTEIYEEFEKLIEKTVDIKAVKIYSVLMLLNILAFIVKHKISDACLAKPFGNSKTFIDLINIHINELGGNVNVW